MRHKVDWLKVLAILLGVVMLAILLYAALMPFNY